MSEKSETELNLDTAQLRAMYNEQTSGGYGQGLPPFDLYEHIVGGLLKPHIQMIFDILPQSPSALSVLKEKMTESDERLLQSIAALCQLDVTVFGLTPDPNANAQFDIYKTSHGDHILHTVDGNATELFIYSEKAAIAFMQHAADDEMISMPEAQQATFLKFLNQRRAHDNTPAHRRLVYSLPIPSELIAYHEPRIKLLQQRIFEDDQLAMGIAQLTGHEYARRKGQATFKTKVQKKPVVHTFMRTLAKIWDTPTPHEEDYNHPPQKNKEGILFESAMQAGFILSPQPYYGPFDETAQDINTEFEAQQNSTKAANDDENANAKTQYATVQKLGFAFGINHYRGYLKRPSMNTIRLLAHEFGHIVSAGICVPEHIARLKKSKALHKDAMNLPPSALQDLVLTKEFMKTNNELGDGYYYNPFVDNFEGLNAPQGKNHPYSGQLEERHADWLGDHIEQAVLQALDAQVYKQDLEYAATKLYFDLCEIMLHLPMKEREGSPADATLTEVEKYAFGRDKKPDALKLLSLAEQCIDQIRQIKIIDPETLTNKAELYAHLLMEQRKIIEHGKRTPEIIKDLCDQLQERCTAFKDLIRLSQNPATHNKHEQQSAQAGPN